MNMIPTIGPDHVARELVEAAERMGGYLFPIYESSYGLSIAYAPPGALTPHEVAAHSEGYVRSTSDNPAIRMVLTAMMFDPETRCVVVIRYSEEIITACKAMLLELCFFDRTREPPGISTIDWGVAFCCERSDGVPDIIYDLGSTGKEPLIRILGENPTLVSARLNRIVTRIMNTNLKEE